MVKHQGEHVEDVILEPPEVLEPKTAPMTYCCGEWFIIDGEEVWADDVFATCYDIPD